MVPPLFVPSVNSRQSPSARNILLWHGIGCFVFSLVESHLTHLELLRRDKNWQLQQGRRIGRWYCKRQHCLNAVAATAQAIASKSLLLSLVIVVQAHEISAYWRRETINLDQRGVQPVGLPTGAAHRLSGFGIEYASCDPAAGVPKDPLCALHATMLCAPAMLGLLPPFAAYRHVGQLPTGLLSTEKGWTAY